MRRCTFKFNVNLVRLTTRRPSLYGLSHDRRDVASRAGSSASAEICSYAQTTSVRSSVDVMLCNESTTNRT